MAELPATPLRFRRRLALAAPQMLPALLTAGLLWLSFFPVNWGWLAWVALIPLLSTLESRRRGGTLAAWYGGFIFSFAATQWIRLANEVMVFAWPLLALIISTAFPIFVWLCRLFMRRLRLPLVFAAPAAWVAAEYVRAIINVGFPWYYLGHSQHDYLPVTQCADIFGAYGVSFVVVMVNVGLYELGRWLRSVAELARVQTGPNSDEFGCRFPRFATASAALAILLTLGYGAFRLSHDDFEKGPTLALIQGNLPQYIRNDSDAVPRTAKHYQDLADDASLSKPDLIVWSETSWPLPYFAAEPGVDRTTLSTEWREQLKFGREVLLDRASRYRRPTLLGMNSLILEPSGEKHYNSALLIDADGNLLDRYHKIDLVPFGEYIPWEDYVPILKWLSPYDEASDYGIAPGRELTVFKFNGWRFAVLICYEDSLPRRAPSYLRPCDSTCNPPQFFINISNDGWFHGSEQHEQHLVASRFRAIECRRAVARAVNMGISCVIDGDGRIHGLPGATWKESKSRTAVVVEPVPIDGRFSLYTLWGDVLPQACWLLWLVAIGVATVPRFRKRR